MEKSTNKSITGILQTSTLLQDYVSKTQNFKNLTQIIRQYLDPELAKNCSVANLVDNKLILATTSATWNHKLKFLIPDLLSQLKKLPQFNKLTKIKIIQEIPITPKNIPKVKKISLSNNNAKQLINAAEYITNKNLSNALLKMAKRLTKDNKTLI
jgi:hypothetical protein